MELKPNPPKKYKAKPAVDADLMQVNRLDFETTRMLAEALLWSRLARFDRVIHELDANWNPTGFTLPPGRYPFIPSELAARWDDERDKARTVALFELSLPGAANMPRHKCTAPLEFEAKILIRVQCGFVLLIGAGSERVLVQWPTTQKAGPRPVVKAKKTRPESAPLFETEEAR
jgi:hypothetical protein